MDFNIVTLKINLPAHSRAKWDVKLPNDLYRNLHEYLYRKFFSPAQKKKTALREKNRGPPSRERPRPSRKKSHRLSRPRGGSAYNSDYADHYHPVGEYSSLLSSRRTIYIYIYTFFSRRILEVINFWATHRILTGLWGGFLRQSRGEIPNEFRSIALLFSSELPVIRLHKFFFFFSAQACNFYCTPRSLFFQQ